LRKNEKQEEEEEEEEEEERRRRRRRRTAKRRKGAVGEVDGRWEEAEEIPARIPRSPSLTEPST